MAFTFLKSRIDDLPLVICGPILRSVTEDSVSVWIALKEERNVTLTIFLEKDKGLLDKKFSSTTKTKSIGENLHITCITAKKNSESLRAGELYYYNLFFEADGTTKNLKTEGIIDFDISYKYEDSMDPNDIEAQISTPPKLPSFSLAPDELDELRIVHGSCRKPNAEGLDAMPTIDTMIASTWTFPSKRPHYLFLTGDQIYADDVSPIVLYMLIDAAKALFGPERQEKFDNQKYNKVLKEKDGEEFTIKNGETIWDGKTLPIPTKRGRLIKHFAGFSYENFHNHLISFGEYSCMYLFVWSDVLWDEMPEFEEIYSKKSNLDDYKNGIESLTKFKATLHKVRRALANVPTYMIFDDHEVTDDWNMSKPWCANVYTKLLGRRIIQNGLLAYVVFQAWGNTPEQFENSEPGDGILKIISEKWNKEKAYFFADPSKIADPLGLPKIDKIFKPTDSDKVIFDTTLDDTELIKWHYHIKIKSGDSATNMVEIIVLDGRTKRSYTKKTDFKAKEYWHANLIHESHQKIQIPLGDSFPLTIIVSPTSIINIPAVDFSEWTYIGELMAYCFNNKGEKYNLDTYDHWKNQSQDFEKLLARIAARGTNSDSKVITRNIILTGDVHFAAASRLEYEKKSSLNGNPQSLVSQAVFAQLVSSSFKKEEYKTRVVHYYGYKFSALGGLAIKYPDFIGLGGLIFLLSPLIHMIDRLVNLTDTSESLYLFDPKLPHSKLFFGWEGPDTFGDLEHLKIKSSNILVRLFEILTQENVIVGNTPVIGTFLENIPETYTKISANKELLMLSKDQTMNLVEDVTFPEPDWRYRIDFIISENEVRESLVGNDLLDVGNPVPPDKIKALKEYLKAAKNHSEFTHIHGSGREIVGLNNVSEISFNWQDDKKGVVQQTWWNLNEKDVSAQFFPLTKYIVPLDFKEENLPKIKNKT